MRTIQRLQEQAYDYLKQMILSGGFSNDEIYSETKTAEIIGISRTPVRDALQRLSQERFIDVLPSRGFRIHRITREDVIETFQMRSAVEGFCAHLIARENNTPKAEECLKQLELSLQKQAVLISGSRNIQEFVEVDNQFHTLIVFYAENQEFNEIFHHYMYRIKDLASHSLLHEGRMESTLKEHTSMYDAMKNGDTDGIYHATLLHMETPKHINLREILT